MRFKFIVGFLVVAVLLAMKAGTLDAQSRLVDAVKRAEKATVRTLLQQRPDVIAAEPDGTTALHWAAHRNDLEIAELLIRAGANVNATNRYGVPPLSLAATNGNAGMLELLLKAEIGRAHV